MNSYHHHTSRGCLELSGSSVLIKMLYYVITGKKVRENLKLNDKVLYSV